MKKIEYIIILFILQLILVGCESSELPVQHADGYEYITFTVEAQKAETRANEYGKYDPTQHPKEMGVFGYHDDANDPNSFIFSNTKVSYQEESKKWEYLDPKKWSDFGSAKTFDFFAYMPHKAVDASTADASTADASTAPSLTLKKGSTYTLSIPFAMPKGNSPFLYDTQSAPIICATGEHRRVKDDQGKKISFSPTINFQFDQTLVGYKLNFKLDEKMGAIRQFRIKEVSISGNILTAGTISRDYTYENKTDATTGLTTEQWTSGKITWNTTGEDRKTFSEEHPIQILHPSSASGSESTENTSLVITSSDFTQWGKTFYAIPDAKFNPTISVKYDVEFVSQDQKNIVTRKDVTSNIVLNKTNFDHLNTTGTAFINNIRILIQPRYLYVLTDDDAYTGYLLIE